MIKTFLLIFRPTPTWEKIASKQESAVSVFFLFLLPLMLLTSAGEAWGLVHWSKNNLNEFGIPTAVPVPRAIDYVAVQFLLSLIILACDAFALKALGETFHGRHTFQRSFTTLAFSLAPLFVFRLLHTVPVLHWWMAWAAGIVFVLAILYQGLGRVMQPDPTNALGLYFMTAVLLVMTTFLGQLVASLILRSKLVVFAPLFR